MKNHQFRPKVLHHFLKQIEHNFMVIEETMVVDVDEVEKKNYKGQGERTHNSYKRNTPYHQKWNHTEAKQNENKGLQNKPTKNYGDKCYKMLYERTLVAYLSYA
jgi:hypothetical protein